jgi:hypothetical protein
MSVEGFQKRFKAFFDEDTLKRKLTCISRNQVPENIEADVQYSHIYAGTNLQHMLQ